MLYIHYILYILQMLCIHYMLYILQMLYALLMLYVHLIVFSFSTVSKIFKRNWHVTEKRERLKISSKQNLSNFGAQQCPNESIHEPKKVAEIRSDCQNITGKQCLATKVCATSMLQPKFSSWTYICILFQLFDSSIHILHIQYY